MQCPARGDPSERKRGIRPLALAILAVVSSHVHHHKHHPRPHFRTAVASYFGGGGGACGGGSWGVANKTLPCGTRLTVCAARCVHVRVTDRGPYIAGREFDLTEDVARAIGPAPWRDGFSMSAGVGTVRVAGG